jgi:hypothetical protein
VSRRYRISVWHKSEPEKQRKPTLWISCFLGTKVLKNEAVKRESQSDTKNVSASISHKKNADSLAQAEAIKTAKKGIVRSLIRISLILIVELVIYLAWTKNGIK